MNVLLLASEEDDIEAISRNIETVNFQDKFELLYRALENHSLTVVEFLLRNNFLCRVSNLHFWKYAFFVLGKTRPNYGKKNICCELMISHGGYQSKCLTSYISGCIDRDDIDGATKALNLHPTIFYLFHPLQLAVQKRHRMLFGILLDRLIEDRIKDCFQNCIYERAFEFAFYLLERLTRQEKDYVTAFFVIEKNPYIKTNIHDFHTYLKIIQRTRKRAANKIYFWWIPICYKKFGSKLAEKDYEKFCALYDV
jgi:hypothetical protein